MKTGEDGAAGNLILHTTKPPIHLRDASTAFQSAGILILTVAFGRSFYVFPSMLNLSVGFKLPLSSELKAIAGSHRRLWGNLLRTAWDTTPREAKFAWLLFIFNALAVITLIEFFLLKHR